MPPTIDLTGYAISHAAPSYSHDRSHRQPPISLECEHVESGHGTHTRCDLRHRTDLTHWCFQCQRRYILDLRRGDGDCRAGDFDDSPESLEIIADMLVDMTPMGPWWYRERDDRAASGGVDVEETWEPSDEELRRLARGWTAGEGADGIGEGWDLFGVDDDGKDGRLRGC